MTRRSQKQAVPCCPGPGKSRRTELWTSAHARRHSENQERLTHLRDPVVLPLQTWSPLRAALYLACEASLSPTSFVAAFGNYLNDSALKWPIAATSGEGPLPAPRREAGFASSAWTGPELRCRMSGGVVLVLVVGGMVEVAGKE